MTTHDHAEALVVRKKLALANASLWADGVRVRFGLMSPEHVVARAVREDARRDLVRAYDAALELDRGAVGR